MSNFDCDYLVVGSGFGGAVSALRLAEKGYCAMVLERGRRIGPEEIAAGRRSLREFAWQPEVVFGGVLLEPGDGVYRDPAFRDTSQPGRQPKPRDRRGRGAIRRSGSYGAVP
jgi:choline dehydrogenase-like flavoprotein